MEERGLIKNSCAQFRQGAMGNEWRSRARWRATLTARKGRKALAAAARESATAQAVLFPDEQPPLPPPGAGTRQVRCVCGGGN